MKWMQMIGWAGLIAMTAVLAYGFTYGNFASDGATLLKNPWGVVSLVDLYAGFMLFSGWIVYREKSPVQAVIWVGLMMVLGFFTGSLYTLYAAYTSKGSWRVFWLGKHAGD